MKNYEGKTLTYGAIKRACEGCSIVFDPALLICQDCDPARFRYCSTRPWALRGKKEVSRCV